ncbi:TonB-dependent receptor domain-containing protein [Caulobacter sp. UC70_42]|uniref:TonB-dependent receptor domain-containing protein n=1 Tax=Caulobacter sp. UC70_42 TaxID=3374551 RepID=UPI003756CB75
MGAKMDLLENRLRVNLAAYAMDRDGTQIDFDAVDTTPGSPTQGAHTEETRNAPGTSKIKGFEADITAKVTQGMTVGLSYAYTDVKIPAAPFPLRRQRRRPARLALPGQRRLYAAERRLGLCRL